MYIIVGRVHSQTAICVVNSCMLGEDICMWFWVAICNSLQSASLSLAPNFDSGVVSWDASYRMRSGGATLCVSPLDVGIFNVFLRPVSPTQCKVGI